MTSTPSDVLNEIREVISHGVKNNQTRERNMAIASERFGLSEIGEAPTLEAIAKRYNMTRERVRQIVGNVIREAKKKGVATPACSAMIEEKSYFTLNDRALFGFSSFAEEFFDITITIERINVRGQRVINRPDYAQRLATIASVSQRFITRNGAAQTHMVYATMASAEQEAPPSFATFLEMLDTMPDIVWLDKATGWFVFQDDLTAAKPNRMRNLINKVLAAAGRPIGVEEIYNQLGRQRKAGQQDQAETPRINMPPAILKALMLLIPEFKHQGFDDFLLRQPKNATSEHLGAGEQMIHAVMVELGGLASRTEVRQQLVDTGKMSMPSLNVIWERSPAFSYVEHGIGKIVGWPIQAEALIRAKAVRRRAERLAA